MAKIVSRRTIALLVLGVLAILTTNVRGMEEAADHGDAPGMLGHLFIPTILLLAMIVLMFWPSARGGKVEPGVAKSAQAEPAMADDSFTVMTVECRYCKTKQKVHVAAHAGGAQVGDQLIPCIKCKKDFAVMAMDRIVGGPFAA
ncbi:MAG: hypothetical protein ABR953_06080 [Candidatus Acidiferrales bacterium]|jgi:hypothetical protein